MDFESEYLTFAHKQFLHIKVRAELGMKQLTDAELHWKPNDESNSIAIIIKHISGNMHSRWVEFLTTDGEKKYRDREKEFMHGNETRSYLMEIWEKGWGLLFSTIENLEDHDLKRTIKLRGNPVSVFQAIQLEIAHLSYHLGQILYIGKQIKDNEWEVLSIPKKKTMPKKEH